MSRRTHAASFRGIPIPVVTLLTFVMLSVLGIAPAWAARVLTSLTVGAGTCSGSSATYLVTVGSTGSGSMTGTLTGPTGLPAGVTGAYVRTTLNFSNGSPTDTTTLVLAMGSSAVAGTSTFTATCSPVSGTGSVTVTAAPAITTQPQPATVRA